MIHKTTTFRITALLLGLVVVGGSSPAVNALEDTTGPRESTNPTTTDQLRQAALEKKKLAQEKREQELKEKRIKQCAAKADGVNNALGKITENRRQIFDRLTEISNKTQAFVTNKQLTVKNYSELVAAVNARKSAAEASINQMVAVNTLDCNAVRTPKDQLQTFHEKRKASQNAINEYRSAIKRLIGAVKVSISSHKGLEGQRKASDQKTKPTGDAR